MMWKIKINECFFEEDGVEENIYFIQVYIVLNVAWYNN